MPDIYTPYRLDDDENVIDPPVIQEHERRLRDAAAAGDDAQIDIVTEDYTAERKRVADRHNDRVTKRRNDDERLLAEDRQRTEREKNSAVRADTERVERENADRLRAERSVNRPEAADPDPDGFAAAAPVGDPAGDPTNPTPTGGLADAGNTPAPLGRDAP